MFVISSLLFLSFLFLIALIFINSRKVKGALPIILVMVWFAVKMPFYIFYSFSDHPLFSVLDVTIQEFLYLLLIKSVFILCCATSYFVFTNNERSSLNNEFIVKKWIVFSALLSGIGFLFMYFSNVGGLSYIWDNMSSRATIMHGNIYLLSLACMLFYLSIILSIRSLGLIWQICILLFCGISTYLAYGSRSISLSFFLIWFVAYYYLNSIAPFKFYKPRYWFIYAMVLVIFVATPLFRTAGAYQKYLNDKGTLLEDIIENYGEIFHRFSVPNIELLVLRHFNENNYWAGSSFLDAMYFFCPAKICKSKPPLDDGVYLYNIDLGVDVLPGTPVSDLVPSSFPFETWSIMYANFGFAGVVNGGFLFGLILALFYNMCLSTNIANHFVGAFSMGLVAIGFFHLSNLYIGLFFFPVFFQWIILTFLGPLIFRKMKFDY